MLQALAAGYTLLDTAAHYGSEVAVAPAIDEAIARGYLDKRDLTVVTKIWFDSMGYEKALASARRSLANLCADRLDTLLVHFPGPPDAIQEPRRNAQLRAETWRALEALQADGLVATIGISNYNRRHHARAARHMPRYASRLAD